MSVALLANKLMPPSLPAVTIAALAVMAPVTAFRVATGGWPKPVGHAVS